LENEEGLWQEIVRKQYRPFEGISQVKQKQNNSTVCNDLIKVKDIYLK
jgi:hypothetical protein